MNDNDFNNLFNGKITTPKEIKGRTKAFKFELYVGDELIFSTKKEIENYEPLGKRGEKHIKDKKLKDYPFTVKWKEL